MSERSDLFKLVEIERQSPKRERLDSGSWGEYRSQEFFRKFSGSKWARFLAGVVATVGIGRIGTETLDLHIPSY